MCFIFLRWCSERILRSKIPAEQPLIEPKKLTSKFFDFTISSILVSGPMPMIVSACQNFWRFSGTKTQAFWAALVMHHHFFVRLCFHFQNRPAFPPSYFGFLPKFRSLFVSSANPAGLSQVLTGTNSAVRYVNLDTANAERGGRVPMLSDAFEVQTIYTDDYLHDILDSGALSSETGEINFSSRRDISSSLLETIRPRRASGARLKLFFRHFLVDIIRAERKNIGIILLPTVERLVG